MSRRNRRHGATNPFGFPPESRADEPDDGLEEDEVDDTAPDDPAADLADVSPDDVPDLTESEGARIETPATPGPPDPGAFESRVNARAFYRDGIPVVFTQKPAHPSPGPAGRDEILLGPAGVEAVVACGYGPGDTFWVTDGEQKVRATLVNRSPEAVVRCHMATVEEIRPLTPRPDPAALAVRGQPLGDGYDDRRRRAGLLSNPEPPDVRWSDIRGGPAVPPKR